MSPAGDGTLPVRLVLPPTDEEVMHHARLAGATAMAHAVAERAARDGVPGEDFDSLLEATREHFRAQVRSLSGRRTPTPPWRGR